jgi:hypothetical protein
MVGGRGRKNSSFGGGRADKNNTWGKRLRRWRTCQRTLRQITHSILKTWWKILHSSKGLYKRWLSAQRNIFQNHQIRHPNYPVGGRLSRIPTSIWEQNGIRDPWTLQHTRGHIRIPFLNSPVPSKGTQNYRLQMSAENKLLMSAAITDLIQKQAIEEIPYQQM